MSENVNANLNINVDPSQALAGLRTLQSQITAFNQSIIASNSAAVASQKAMLSTLVSQIGATKSFSTSMMTVESSVSSLGRAIDKNKLSLGEYFRYGIASSKTFGRAFTRENAAIMGLAEERVKRLQTQFLALEQAQGGMTRALAVRPLSLFNADAAVAVQRQQLFNKLLHDGSTSLINWGKNTQWAGRQLQVGFTVPLTIFGGIAGKIFMDLEKQIVKFRRVYGDATTPLEETNGMIQQIQELGKEFTKYGIAVSDTIALASDAAAAGAQADDLIAQTAQATRLATLGMMDQQEALTATMALQSAFRLSSEQLAEAVNFLNAVENQTVVSLQDISQAIPTVAPVIQGLGGDVQDLAMFMAAMREGGVNAAEGANALKSGLASLINPTKNAREQLEKVGINIDAIIKQNKGDLRGIVTSFGEALSELGKFERQQVLAKVFGKYQFARLGALFENISREGSQAQRVLDLTGQSLEDLAGLADKELGAIEESVGTQFTASVERLRLAIAPLGETFLKVATPIIDFATKILDKFNELSPGVKQFATVLGIGLGVVIPTVTMLIGLFGNFIGQTIKGFAVFSNFFSRITNGADAMQYLSEQELDAMAAAASLEGQTNSLTGSLNVQREAVESLTRAYSNYVAGANAAASGLPQGFRGPRPAARPPQRFARGGMVGGFGNQDTEPALLTPGEFVMNRQATQQFGPILDAMNRGKVSGYNDGSRLVQYGGREFTAQSVRSVGSITSLLESLGVANSDKIVSALEMLASENRLTRASLEAALKDVGVQVRNLPSGMAKAHVFEQSQVSVSPSEARRMVAESGSQITSQSFLRLLSGAEELEAAGAAGALKFLPRSDLIVDLPAQINEALKRGISATDFASALEEGGVSKWSKTVKLAGVNAEEAAPQFEMFDRRVREIAASHQGLIGDTEDASRNMRSFGSITRQAMQELGDEIPLVKTTFDTLESRFRTFQVSLNQEMIPTLQNLGFTIDRLTTEMGDDIFRISGAGLSAPIDVRARAERVSALGGYRGVKSGPELREARESARIAGRSTSQAAIRGLEEGAQTGSESREAQRVANDTVNGYVNQVERRIPEAKIVGERLSEATVAGVASGTSDIRQILKDRLGVGPIVEQEQAQLRETIALRQAENKELEKRMMLLVSRGASPISARRMAEQQLATEKAQVPVVPQGAQLLPIVSQDLERNTQDASKKMGTVKTYAGKLGNVLMRGSMKFQGAFFALDGLLFGLSMMEGSVGQIAQKVLPFAFAIQGVTMALPALKAALPLLLNPIGAAAAALAAVAVGAFLLKKGMDNTIAAGKQMADSMTIADDEIKSLAEFFGNTPRDLTGLAEAQQIAGLTPETTAEGREFVQTEYGKTFVEDARRSFEQNAENFATNLATQLSVAVINNAVTPQQANAIAAGVAEALGQEELTADIIGQINQILDPVGNDITNSPLQILASITANVEADEASLKAAAEAAAGAFDQSPFSTDNFLNLGALYSGEYDEMIRTSIAYYDAIIANSATLANVAANELAVQDEKIRRLDEQARKEKDVNKRREIEEEAQKERDRRALLVAEQKATMDERRRTAVDYIMSREGAELNAVVNSMRQGIEAQAPGLDATQAAWRARTALQARREELGLPALSSEEINRAVYGIEFDIQVGNIDALSYKILNDLIAEGGETGAAASRTLGIVFDLQTKGQVEEAGQLADIYATMTEKQRVEFDVVVNTPGKSPEEIIAYGNFLKQLPDDLPANIRTEITTAASGMSVPELQTYGTVLSTIGSLPEILKKDINIQTLGAQGLLDITDAYSLFEKKKNVKKQAQVAFGTTDPQQIKANLDAMGMSLEEFAKKPSSFKMAIMAAANVQLTAPAGMAPDRIPGWLAQQRRDLIALTASTLEVPTTPAGGTDTPVKDTPSGGSKTKPWLEQLIEDTQADLKLLPNMINRLRSGVKGKFPPIPEQIIEMIGMGPEGLERARQIFNASSGKIKKLVSDFTRKTFNDVMQDLQGRARQQRQKNTFFGVLQSRGFLPDEARSLAQDQSLIEGYFAAFTQQKLNPKSDALNKFWNALNDVLQLQKQFDNDPIKQALDAEENAYKASTKAIDDLIRATQDSIDATNDEISAIQDLVDAEQDKIDAKEREQELIQRQIDAKERDNELDERKIRNLKREDELRNRVAESLSRELDIMSRAENAIRESYEERIQSLEKVQSINQNLINQQKQQLGLTDALTRGDIAAAAAAAQEMEAASAQAAMEEARAGLQQGMQNAIGALRTSGGLTRGQAEKQINDIREQSYQTSLLIRDIEDDIYQRNLDIIPLKDQQLKIDGEIQVIQDSIYNKQLLIKQIEDGRLKPLEDQLDAQNDIKKAIDDTYNAKVDSIKNDETLINKADTLRGTWNTVKDAILAANKAAQGEISKLKVPDVASYKTSDQYKAAQQAYLAELDKIESRRKAAVSAAMATGTSAMAGAAPIAPAQTSAPATPNFYDSLSGLSSLRNLNLPAGMFNIGYYSRGGLVGGSGGRDSMSAMLTPGEFVIRKSMVDKYGTGFLSKINSGSFSMPTYSFSPQAEIPSATTTSSTSISAPVYNTYSVNVNVPNTNADPDMIANKVMMKLTQIEGANIRRLRGN